MAISHHFTPRRQLSIRLTLAERSAVFVLPRSSDAPFSARSCMSHICRGYEGRFALNISIKSGNTFSHTVDLLTVQRLYTIFVEGLVERHKVTANFT